MSELAQQKSANAWLRKCIAMRDAQIDDLVAERDAALDQRDYLVSEYERAVKCGPQGFAHAAGHLYNAISNAKCDANAERFIAIQNERDAAIEREQDKKEYVHRLCLDYQSLCEKLEMSWEREQALVAHVERLREDIYDQAETIYGEFGVRETIDGYLPDSYNESPTASLAHRDLIKQAEALEYAAANVAKWTECETLRGHAKDLRQRAQALK